MKILLTGSFGNIGQSSLKALINKNHHITCFDLPTKKNKKIEKKLQKENEFLTIWGDITDQESVSEAVKNQECIIHLVGITPPLTEKRPELAYAINVLGTKYVIGAALKQSKPPKIIYSSSFSIYGPKDPSSPLLDSKQPINPTDVYTENKAAAEKIIQESGLPWTIFRIAATPSLIISENDLNLLYTIPMDQNIEFLHTYDCGLAFANAVNDTTNSKILMIGGGEKCQFINRDFVRGYLETLGVGMLPEKIFKQVERPEDWYYTNWLDTEESQELLQYQKHTFEDYLKELRKKTRILRLFTMLFRPIIKRYLITKSPYYKKT